MATFENYDDVLTLVLALGESYVEFSVAAPWRGDVRGVLDLTPWMASYTTQAPTVQPRPPLAAYPTTGQRPLPSFPSREQLASERPASPPVAVGGCRHLHWPRTSTPLEGERAPAPPPQQPKSPPPPRQPFADARYSLWGTPPLQKVRRRLFPPTEAPPPPVDPVVAAAAAEEPGVDEGDSGLGCSIEQLVAAALDDGDVGGYKENRLPAFSRRAQFYEDLTPEPRSPWWPPAAAADPVLESSV